jgi:hypothetical protein
MPPLVWVESGPLTFWLDRVAVVNVLLLAACCNSTSKILPKAMCSRSSTITGRSRVVEGCEEASFPDHERC